MERYQSCANDKSHHVKLKEEKKNRHNIKNNNEVSILPLDATYLTKLCRRRKTEISFQIFCAYQSIGLRILTALFLFVSKLYCTAFVFYSTKIVCFFDLQCGDKEKL